MLRGFILSEFLCDTSLMSAMTSHTNAQLVSLGVRGAMGKLRCLRSNGWEPCLSLHIEVFRFGD